MLKEQCDRAWSVRKDMKVNWPSVLALETEVKLEMQETQQRKALNKNLHLLSASAGREVHNLMHPTR